MRGEAEKRQVKNVKYALSHNIGLGGAAVVGIYKLAFPQSTSVTSQKQEAASNEHKSKRFFDEIEAKLKEDGASLINKVKATIGFTITLSNNQNILYVIDLKNAPGSVYLNVDGSK